MRTDAKRARDYSRAMLAAKVCRHADPRCILDPCPFGIWKVLCDPARLKTPSVESGR